MANVNKNKNMNSLIAGFTVIFVLLLVVFASVALFNPTTKATISNEARITPSLAKVVMGNTGDVRVLITTETHDYSALVNAIVQMGGTVHMTFTYATGLAATVPVNMIQQLSQMAGVIQIGLDVDRTTSAGNPNNFLPANARDTIDEVTSDEAIPLNSGFQTVTATPADVANNYNPNTYNLGNVMDNGGVLSTGNYGQDTLAVIIDTGIYSDHFMLRGNVIGGEDFSTDVGTPYEGYNLATNHWHGTHVAGILAGHGGLLLPNDDILAQSIEYHSGTALPSSDLYPDYKVLWLFGVAPDTQLYGIKVFPHTGAGASESTIIAAMERAITMKVVEGTDVDVISMSLGGWNGFDGRDLEDMTVDAATAAGITVVVAAGNEGPISETIGSPGTAKSAITVGAVANPINTRVFWDNYYNWLGVGDYLYPTNDNQMIYFSSRGPTIDGRDKPTASALGVFVLSSYNTASSPQSIAWASGTSMATPAMSGVVSLLNTYGESLGATPHDYKEAVEEGSTPMPGYDEYDQGAGLVSATNAMAALQKELADDDHHNDQTNDEEEDHHDDMAKFYSKFSSKHEKPKGEKLKHLDDADGTTFDVSLTPGMANHYWFKLKPNVARITITFTNVDYGFDALGMNSLETYFQSGNSGSDTRHIDSTNVWGDTTFVVEDYSTTATGYYYGAFLTDMPINPGYAKFVVENDWTSFDTVSATVTVKVDLAPASGPADETYSGVLADKTDYGWLPVGFGTNGVQLELSWQHDYFHYPVADMDLIVAWFDTDGFLYFEWSGATLNSPELVVINANNVDFVLVIVSAYNTYGFNEPWQLDVTYL